MKQEKPLPPSLQHLRIAGPPRPPGAHQGGNPGYVHTIPDGGRQVFSGTVSINGQNPTLIRGASNTRRRICLLVLDRFQSVLIGDQHVGNTGINSGFPVFGPKETAGFISEPAPFVVNSKGAIWAIAPNIADNVRVAYFDEFDQYDGG